MYQMLVFAYQSQSHSKKHEKSLFYLLNNGQLPPLGHERTLPDRGRSMRIPAYIAENTPNPSRHAADTLHRHQRAAISLPRVGNPRNALQKLQTYRRPVLTPQTGQTQRNRNARGRMPIRPGSPLSL